MGYLPNLASRAYVRTQLLTLERHHFGRRCRNVLGKPWVLLRSIIVRRKSSRTLNNAKCVLLIDTLKLHSRHRRHFLRQFGLFGMVILSFIQWSLELLHLSTLKEDAGLVFVMGGSFNFMRLNLVNWHRATWIFIRGQVLVV